jgi:hypothetical protein
MEVNRHQSNVSNFLFTIFWGEKTDLGLFGWD